MTRIHVTFFGILLMTLLFSCSSNRNDEKISIAKSQTERYYKFYDANETDSVSSITSVTGQDSSDILNYLNKAHKVDGPILSRDRVQIKLNDKYIDLKHEIDIDISYKVKYKSGDVTRETFNFVFDNEDSNKIYSFDFVEWKEGF